MQRAGVRGPTEARWPHAAPPAERVTLPTVRVPPVAWAILALLAAAVVAALALLVARSLSVEGAPGMDAWRDVVGEATLRNRLAVTLWQALASTVIGVAAGLPASYLLSLRGAWGARVLGALLLVPLATPPVVYALGVRELLGRALAGEAASLAMIVAAHSAMVAAAVVWLVTPAWGVVDPRALEAARVLGATRGSAFWALTWPPVGQQLRAACALGFALAFTAFATVLVLGGPEEQTLEATAFERARLAGAGRAEAAALVLAQAVLLAATLALGRAWWRWPAPSATAGPRASAALRACALLYLAPLAAIALAPLAAVAVAASQGGASGLASVGPHSAGAALAWTLGYALASAALATLLAWAAARVTRGARGRVLVIAVVLAALALTPVALGLALFEVTRVADLTRTPATVVVAHALLAAPLAWRALALPASPARARLVEAAQVLGEPPGAARQRWLGRRALAALAAASAFSLALSAMEAGAAWLLAPADAVPAAVVVLEAATTVATPDGAMHRLAAVLAAATLGAFLLADALRRRSARELHVEPR